MAALLIQLGLPDWLAWAITAGIAAALILNVIAVGALVFIWAERKIAARIQDRLGPTRTGGRFGWLQSLADGIKLLAKEDLMPEGADGLLFRIAPNSDHFDADAYPARITPNTSSPRTAITKNTPTLSRWATTSKAKGSARNAQNDAQKLT